MTIILVSDWLILFVHLSHLILHLCVLSLVVQKIVTKLLSVIEVIETRLV